MKMIIIKLSFERLLSECKTTSLFLFSQPLGDSISRKLSPRTSIKFPRCEHRSAIKRRNFFHDLVIFLLRGHSRTGSTNMIFRTIPRRVKNRVTIEPENSSSWPLQRISPTVSPNTPFHKGSASPP